jgi:NAD(P)-dependent dehydrogenase (short-subunit alcohol dehydrogenase family)
MNGHVCVTGGAKGIGAAIVEALVTAGYEVTFTYHASEERARQLIERLEAAHPEAVLHAVRCDLGLSADLERLCEGLTQSDPPLYGLIHNAGVSYDRLVETIDLEAAQLVMQVNYWAMVALAKALLPGMRRRQSGRLIYISSVAAELGRQGNGIYAASKAAMHGFMGSVVAEAARKGVTFNCVAPGFVDTDLVAGYDRDALAKRIPSRRFGEPSEVAAVVGFLLSAGAAYVNGAILRVDGGLSACAGPA